MMECNHTQNPPPKKKWPVPLPLALPLIASTKATVKILDTFWTWLMDQAVGNRHCTLPPVSLYQLTGGGAQMEPEEPGPISAYEDYFVHTQYNPWFPVYQFRDDIG